MENKKVIEFLKSLHTELLSIVEHNPDFELLEKWKSKLVPYLDNNSKVKINRIKIFDSYEMTYDSSMYVNEHELKMAETILRDTAFKYSNKKSEDSMKALKLLQAREENIEFELELAELICGGYSSFPYRNSQELTDFFQNLGHDFTHYSETRNEWVKDRLEELNIKEIHTLISKGLFRKKYFTNCRTTQENIHVSYEEGIKEFKNFIQESVTANASLDLATVLDMNVNIELLFDNKANTKDKNLNDLVEEAKERYLNNDKQIGLEKLWDAYERIKTYFLSEEIKKKNVSADKLSQTISKKFDKKFIDDEFSMLTDIGNGYRIRHHEADKKELTPEYINYFFFRMLSFIDLCLVFLNKQETEDSSLF